MSHAARKEQFYYQLATLLDSGLSIQSSIDHLQQQRGNAMHALAVGLKRGVGEGMTLGDALKTYGGNEADPLDIATLRAAERGGKIEHGAKHLAEYYQLQAKLWQQIKGAMAYPLLVLHAAILLPAITVLVGETGGLFQAVGIPLLIAYGVIGALWFGGRFLHRESAWNESFDRLLAAIPFIGRLRQKLSLSRFCQVLQIQLQTGGQVSEAVKSAGVASGTARLKHEAKEMAKQISEHGVPLGPLLLSSRAMPSTLSQVLNTAETVGRLDEEAGLRAKQLMGEAAQAASTAGVWIPKLAYVPIALYAIYKIISFYSGYTESLGTAF